MNEEEEVLFCSLYGEQQSKPVINSLKPKRAFFPLLKWGRGGPNFSFQLSKIEAEIIQHGLRVCAKYIIISCLNSA